MAISESSVLYEGYLQKTKLIDWLNIVKGWRRKYFELTRSESGDLALNYYDDDTKKSSTCKTISLNQSVQVDSKISIGTKDYCFSLELPHSKTVVFKSNELKVKNTWVAKLMEALNPNRLFHVDIPYQPLVRAEYRQGLLKLVSKEEVSLLCPSSSQPVTKFQMKHLKSFGCSNDGIWFEKCPCLKDNSSGVYCFNVGSGIDTCYNITSKIKFFVETATGTHVIKSSDDGNNSIVYCSPAHYTCPPTPDPSIQVGRILKLRRLSVKQEVLQPGRKLSTQSMSEVEPTRSRTYSVQSPPHGTTGSTAQGMTRRTSLKTFRQTSAVSFDGIPLTRINTSSSVDFSPSSSSSSIVQTPPKSAGPYLTPTSRQNSQVFDADGLSPALSKVSITPKSSNGSSDQDAPMDMPRNAVGVTSMPTYTNGHVQADSMFEFPPLSESVPPIPPRSEESLKGVH